MRETNSMREVGSLGVVKGNDDSKCPRMNSSGSYILICGHVPLFLVLAILFYF